MNKAIAKDRKGAVILTITAAGVESPDADTHAWIHAAFPNLREGRHEAFVCYVSRVAARLGMEHLDFTITTTPPAPLPDEWEVW